VPQNLFVGRVAQGYDLGSPEMWDAALLAVTADFLAANAHGGPGWSSESVPAASLFP
jgi:hypothetical protein